MCDDSVGLKMVASCVQIQQHAVDSSTPLYQKYLHTCQVTVRKMALHVENIGCSQTE